MQIKSTLTNRLGQVCETLYCEGMDPVDGLEGKNLQVVHAFCLYNGKMILVNHPKSGWMPPGGHIEPGEAYEDAIVREVQEETNMKVLRQELIGFMDVWEPNRTVRQIRSFCIVEPYGDFVEDPDGEIMEMKLIDPADYKQYFNWGEAGERIMERVQELAKGL